MGPEAGLAICRFGFDAAAMGLWGAFAYLRVLVPRALADETAACLDGLRTGAIVVVLVTTIALLPCEAAAIGEGWHDAFDPAVVAAVLLDTGVGQAWQARAIAALVLAATLALPRPRRLGATAAASALPLASIALTGHAAMHEGWLGLVHRLNDIVHLLAGGAWFGALCPLLSILRALDDPYRRRDAGIALRRFSAAGHAAVAIVIASGAVNTWLVLARWPTDWSSPYQTLLAAKIALVLTMAALALVNRYVLVPRMASRHGTTLRALRLATIVEIGLGFAAILCVSVFGLIEPA